jgi:uncharacterized membrane protein YraQ (UPF0718 family)
MGVWAWLLIGIVVGAILDFKFGVYIVRRLLGRDRFSNDVMRKLSLEALIEFNKKTTAELARRTELSTSQHTHEEGRP